jgi:hypothetical protein
MSSDDTVDERDARIVALLSACLDERALSARDRLAVAAEFLYAEGARVGLTPHKINAGGLNEKLVALARQHETHGAMHGADSVDARGATYEHKNSIVLVRSALKTSFVYRQPVRHDGERVAPYVERVRAHWLRVASGAHLLNVIVGTRCVATYEIKARFMADYLCEWTRWRLSVGAKAPYQAPVLNLGSLPCTRCGVYRRAARLVAEADADASNAPRAARSIEAWRLLFATPTSRNCVSCERK